MDQHLNIIKCEHIKCVGVYMADEIYTAGNSVTDTDTWDLILKVEESHTGHKYIIITRFT